MTVGALVQANYGVREMLRVAGYPVGEVLRHVPSPFRAPDVQGEAGMGSIVVTIATDAPLLPHQCTRLAQRASVGLARAGGGTEDSSGDIFLAFATGNDGLPAANYGNKGAPTTDVKMVNNDHISALFVAAAEAVEEAIVNALVAGGDVESRGRGSKGWGRRACWMRCARWAGGRGAAPETACAASIEAAWGGVAMRRSAGPRSAGPLLARACNAGGAGLAVTTRRHAQLPK